MVAAQPLVSLPMLSACGSYPNTGSHRFTYACVSVCLRLWNLCVCVFLNILYFFLWGECGYAIAQYSLVCARILTCDTHSMSKELKTQIICRWMLSYEISCLLDDNSHVRLTIFLIYLFILLLLFNYSCLHFLPIPPPHPSQTHLPPLLPPSPLILCMCPLQYFLKTLLPTVPSPLPSGYCQIVLKTNHVLVVQQQACSGQVKFTWNYDNKNCSSYIKASVRIWVLKNSAI